MNSSMMNLFTRYIAMAEHNNIIQREELTYAQMSDGERNGGVGRESERMCPYTVSLHLPRNYLLPTIKIKN